MLFIRLQIGWTGQLNQGEEMLNKPQINIPHIDLNKPEHLETATFALG